MCKRVSAVLAVYSFLGLAMGQVVMDSALGQAGALAGPDFKIRANLGKTVGDNLFHSFAEFSLGEDQSSTFTGPEHIQNILGRVTGKKASQIDGLIKSEIAGANLFLMNPHGIVLGKSAEVDVTGSFVLTAQDRIKMGESAEFTTKTDVSSFSQAEPEAFGFLGSNPAGNIELNTKKLTLTGQGGAVGFVGKEIVTGKNSGLTLSGYADVIFEANKVGFNGGTELNVISSHENIPSNLSFMADEIRIERSKVNSVSAGKEMPLGSITMSGLDGMAESVLITGRSKLKMDNEGEHPGDLVVHAKTVALNNGSFIGLNTSVEQGPSLRVEAGIFTTDMSDVECLTTGKSGFGGGIAINANKIEIKGYLRTRSGDNLIAGSWTGDAENQRMDQGAKGGDITLNATEVRLEKTSISRSDPTGWITTNGMESGLSTIATSSGDAGHITVNADKLEMIGGALRRGGDPLGVATKTHCSIYSWTKIRPNGGLKQKAGKGGDIRIHCSEVTMIDASIKAMSHGSGDLGGIVMKGKTFQLFGVKDQHRVNSNGFVAYGPHISNRVLSDNVSGDWKYENAQNGDLLLDFTEIEMNKGGVVVDSMGKGKGGRVELTAETFSASFSGFRAYVDKEGEGRDIVIRADDIDLESSWFESTTNGVGVGADIRLTAENFIHIRKCRFETDRVQTAKNETGRDAGDLFFSAPEIRIVDRSYINSSVGGSAIGDGGNVTLTGDRIFVTGFSNIASDIWGRGRGGVVKLEATSSIKIDGSTLSASSRKPRNPARFGDGGTIQLSAETVELSNGTEVKADTASKGNGGEVEIYAKTLIVGGLDKRGGRTGILSETILSANRDKSTLEGNAGAVTIRAELVELRDGGYISTASKGFGNEGAVVIDADRLSIENGEVKSEGTHAGSAGSVDLRLAKGLSLGQGASISVTASQADGGDIRVATDGQVHLVNSELTAAAAGNGGSVRLLGAGDILLKNSRISAESGVDGGDIDVRSPNTLVLQRSGLLANAIHGNGGNIAVAAYGYLPSQESVVSASSEFGLEGSVKIDTPETNVGSGLTILPDSLGSRELNIAERCTLRLQGDASSFFLKGNGGISLYSSENYLPSVLEAEE